MSLSLCQTHKILNDILSYQITPYSINNSLNQKFTSSEQISFNKNSNIHTIVKIKLSVLNTKNHQQIFNQTFPQLTFNFEPTTEYIFPEEPTRYSTSPGKFVANHGGRMHYPFVSFKLSKFDGLIIVSSDHYGRFREISMTKEEKGTFDVRFKYYDLCLQPNENYDFDDAYLVLFKIKKSFLNDSLKVYKEISSEWIKNSQKMEKLIANPFHSSFLLRVIEFYELEWHHSHKRVQNVSKLNLLQLIKEDEQLVGPIKCIHLRDWSAEGKDLSCKFGNYLKERMVGEEISKE